MKTHTAGEWTVEVIRQYEQGFDTVLIRGHGEQADAMNEDNQTIARLTQCPNAQANAQLIAEAGTVANETGRTPRQLQAINAELVEALEEMVNTFTAGESGMHLIRLHAIETLARAKSNP